MYKLSEMHIDAVSGGFIVDLVFEKDNKDGNPVDNQYEKHVIPTYAKLMKFLRTELADFKPERKPRVKMSGVQQ